MAIPNLFDAGNAIVKAKANASDTAFGRLIEAMKSGATATAEPVDPALNFDDVKGILPILLGLEAIAGRPGATQPFLSGAQARKSSMAQTETERRKIEADRANRESQKAIEIAKLGYEHADQQRGEAVSTQRYYEGTQERRRERELSRRDKADELALKTKTETESKRLVHAGTLSRQYGDAVKFGSEGNIRRTAQILQSLADKYPDEYGAYAPTKEQIELDVETAKNDNRTKASEAWAKETNTAAKTHGLIDDKLYDGLLAKRARIAKRYEMDPEELGPIATAKTVGFKKLEETVRANKAREGENVRNHDLIDAHSKERIAIFAGHLAVAEARANIAQQNSNTYLAVAHGKAALGGAQTVWGEADKNVRALNARIAGETDGAKKEKLLAERDYWEGLKTQATMTADQARTVQGVLDASGMGGILPQVPVPTHPLQPFPSPLTGPFGGGGGGRGVNVRPSPPAGARGSKWGPPKVGGS